MDPKRKCENKECREAWIKGNDGSDTKNCCEDGDAGNADALAQEIFVKRQLSRRETYSMITFKAENMYL